VLYVEAKPFQDSNVGEVFNVNSGFSFSVDSGGVCGDDGHGRISVFAVACHSDFVKIIRVFVIFF